MLRSQPLLALTRAARPPIKLRRRAALSLLTPMPASAMWQLWLPSDMERFVAEADATADSCPRTDGQVRRDVVDDEHGFR